MEAADPTFFFRGSVQVICESSLFFHLNQRLSPAKTSAHPARRNAYGSAQLLPATQANVLQDTFVPRSRMTESPV